MPALTRTLPGLRAWLRAGVGVGRGVVAGLGVELGLGLGVGTKVGVGVGVGVPDGWGEPSMTAPPVRQSSSRLIDVGPGDGTLGDVLGPGDAAGTASPLGSMLAAGRQSGDGDASGDATGVVAMGPVDRAGSSLATGPDASCAPPSPVSAMVRMTAHAARTNRAGRG